MLLSCLAALSAMPSITADISSIDAVISSEKAAWFLALSEKVLQLWSRTEDERDICSETSFMPAIIVFICCQKIIEISGCVTHFVPAHDGKRFCEVTSSSGQYLSGSQRGTSMGLEMNFLV